MSDAPQGEKGSVAVPDFDGTRGTTYLSHLLGWRIAVIRVQKHGLCDADADSVPKIACSPRIHPKPLVELSLTHYVLYPSFVTLVPAFFFAVTGP